MGSEVKIKMQEGRGRLFRIRNGKYLIYVPKDLAEDSMFPFPTRGSKNVKKLCTWWRRETDNRRMAFRHKGQNATGSLNGWLLLVSRKRCGRGFSGFLASLPFFISTGPQLSANTDTELGKTNNPPKKPPRGWGFPRLSKKAHYFVDGRSLCGKWLFTGDLEDSNDDSPDNCTACKKAVRKLREKEKKPMLKDVAQIREGVANDR